MSTTATTARDGVYTVLQQIKGSSPNYLKAVYDFDRAYQTDISGDGYPYATVVSDGKIPVKRGTITTHWADRIKVRVYVPYVADSATEDDFLALSDLVLTTLENNANLTLNGTVLAALVDDVNHGFTTSDQLTLRVAEYTITVRQITSRT